LGGEKSQRKKKRSKAKEGKGKGRKSSKIQKGVITREDQGAHVKKGWEGLKKP